MLQNAQVYETFTHTRDIVIFKFVSFAIKMVVVYHMDKSTLLSPELKAKGVGVGVAVLLSSADNNVLVILFPLN